MKVLITKIEECVGGVSICVRYHEPENHLRFFNTSTTNEQDNEYTAALNEFDRDIKKLHIGNVMELTRKED